MLKDKIKNKETGFLFYGLTPPKLNTEEEKIKAIAAKQMERLKDAPIDALIVYDVQDESARISTPRPFPYMQMLAPDDYSANYLNSLKVPKIIYKSVGKFTRDSFRQWVANDNIEYCVLVGAPSPDQKVELTLDEAYKIRKELNPSITLGGVTIPERHIAIGGEQNRIAGKIEKGCSFFVSQCVYSVNNAKNFLSDYYYWARENNQEIVPIIFTLTPCGSLKTLEFMNWLGIDVPNWLKNEMQHSQNILDESIRICKSIAKELLEYCRDKNIPMGFNIESVSIRKEEIKASIELLKSIKEMME